MKSKKHAVVCERLYWWAVYDAAAKKWNPQIFDTKRSALCFFNEVWKEEEDEPTGRIYAICRIRVEVG